MDSFLNDYLVTVDDGRTDGQADERADRQAIRRRTDTQPNVFYEGYYTMPCDFVWRGIKTNVITIAYHRTQDVGTRLKRFVWCSILKLLQYIKKLLHCTVELCFSS